MIELIKNMDEQVLLLSFPINIYIDIYISKHMEEKIASEGKEEYEEETKGTDCAISPAVKLVQVLLVRHLQLQQN